MRLKIKNGILYNEEGKIIAVMSADANEEDERLIELGSEAVPALEKFIENVRSGSFKPRTEVKEFEKLFEKYAI